MTSTHSSVLILLLALSTFTILLIFSLQCSGWVGSLGWGTPYLALWNIWFVIYQPTSCILQIMLSCTEFWIQISDMPHFVRWSAAMNLTSISLDIFHFFSPLKSILYTHCPCMPTSGFWNWLKVLVLTVARMVPEVLQPGTLVKHCEVKYHATTWSPIQKWTWNFFWVNHNLS